MDNSGRSKIVFPPLHPLASVRLIAFAHCLFWEALHYIHLPLLRQEMSVAKDQTTVPDTQEQEWDDIVFPPGDLWSDEPALESYLHLQQPSASQSTRRTRFNGDFLTVTLVFLHWTTAKASSSETVHATRHQRIKR